MDTKKGNRRFSIVHLTVIIAVAAIVILFTVLSLLVYRAALDSRIVRTATSVLPYPAAMVNGEAIWMKSVSDQYTALLKYYGGTAQEFEQALPGGEDVVADILDNLIRKKLIYQMAEERAIEATEDEIETMMQEIIDNTGTPDEAEQQIAESFGWSLGEFKENVVEPLVLSSKIEEIILTDLEVQGEKKTKADKAWELVQAGENFSEVAKEYSEDSTAADGGHLGFISIDILPEDWREAISVLEEGQITDVVETTYAYGIFYVSNIVDGEYNLYLIGIEKVSMGEVISMAMEEAKIWSIAKE